MAKHHTFSINDYISYLLHDPRFTLNAFYQHYKKFNIPLPTQEDIVNNMLKATGEENTLTEQEKKQIENSFRLYVEDIFEFFKNSD